MTPTRLRTTTLAVLFLGAVSTVALYVSYELRYVDSGEVTAAVFELAALGSLPYALIAVGTARVRTFEARVAGLAGAVVTLIVATAYDVQIVFGPPDSKSGVGLMIVLALLVAIAVLTVGVSWVANHFSDDA